MAEHTPGPWEAFEHNIDDGEGVFYIESNGEPLPYTAANLYLLDAAPDMLVALKSITLIREVHPAVRVLEAAIAKARGES